MGSVWLVFVQILGREMLQHLHNTHNHNPFDTSPYGMKLAVFLASENERLGK